MIELILGVLVSPYLWGLLFLFSFLAEANDASGWCGFMWAILLIAVLFTFQPGFVTALLIIGGYILVGIGWSIFRYRKHISDSFESWKANEVARHELERKRNPESTTYPIEMFIGSITHKGLSPIECSDKIVYWAIFWPPSFVSYLLGDFAKELIMKIAGKTYGSFYDKLTTRVIIESNQSESKDPQANTAVQ